jgi:hypothetical protein
MAALLLTGKDGALRLYEIRCASPMEARQLLVEARRLDDRSPTIYDEAPCVIKGRTNNRSLAALREHTWEIAPAPPLPPIPAPTTTKRPYNPDPDILPPELD